jgi:Acyl-CoA synthetases (AMP-forming)/AMP-acid ligases II
MARSLFEIPKRGYLSYVKGQSTKPLRESTIFSLLREITGKFPDKFAVHSYHQDISLTYTELYNKAHNIAGALVHLGFKPGDRLAIVTPNRYEWYVMQLAASISGIMNVCLNYAYQANELKNALKAVRCFYFLYLAP